MTLGLNRLSITYKASEIAPDYDAVTTTYHLLAKTAYVLLIHFTSSDKIMPYLLLASLYRARVAKYLAHVCLPGMNRGPSFEQRKTSRHWVSSTVWRLLNASNVLNR